MTTRAAKSDPTPKPARKRALWYRGVRLQTPATAPRTPLIKLQQAVEAAVAKNADALAAGK